MRRARRAFVVAWLVLGIAGALNHTRFDLFLPHLKYRHVMFSRNSRRVTLYGYTGSDGARHDLADLMITPAPGYARARLTISVATKPDYLDELCLRAERAGRGPLTFLADDYDLTDGAPRPTGSRSFLCDAHGLTAR